MPRGKGFWLGIETNKATEVYDHENYVRSNPKQFGMTLEQTRKLKNRKDLLIGAMKKGWARMRQQRGYTIFEHHWRDRPDLFFSILTFMKKHKSAVHPNDTIYISHVKDGVDYEGTAKKFVEMHTPRRGKGVRYDPKTVAPEDWGHETEIFNMLRKRIFQKKGIPFESVVTFEQEFEVLLEVLSTIRIQRPMMDMDRLYRDFGFECIQEPEVFVPIEPREFGTVSEAGLSRVWAMTKKPFAIITAFRDDIARGATSKARLKANRQMNRKLLSFLNTSRMGAYKLIGHWEEAPEGMDYAVAKLKGLTQDVTEESFMVPKPKEMPESEFRATMVALMRAYKQDAIVYGDGSKVMLVFQDGAESSIGTKPSFNRVAQAYSQLRKRPGVPFVFEGVVAPINVMSRQAFSTVGLLWPSTA